MNESSSGRRKTGRRFPGSLFVSLVVATRCHGLKLAAQTFTKDVKRLSYLCRLKGGECLTIGVQNFGSVSDRRPVRIPALFLAGANFRRLVGYIVLDRFSNIGGCAVLD
jgi:hypothetical protein